MRWIPFLALENMYDAVQPSEERQDTSHPNTGTIENTRREEDQLSSHIHTNGMDSKIGQATESTSEENKSAGTT
jgi:hypothetical protein